MGVSPGGRVEAEVAARERDHGGVGLEDVDQQRPHVRGERGRHLSERAIPFNTLGHGTCACVCMQKCPCTAGR